MGMKRTLACLAFVTTGAFADGGCIDQLARPVYTPLALQARISALLYARFTIGADGKVGALQVDGHWLLVPTVVESLRASTVDPGACAGRSFEVSYEFLRLPAAPERSIEYVRLSDGFVITGVLQHLTVCPGCLIVASANDRKRRKLARDHCSCYVEIEPKPCGVAAR